MSTFLKRRHRVGIVGSTDHHSGNTTYSLRRCDVTRRTVGALFSRFSPSDRGTALLAEDFT